MVWFFKNKAKRKNEKPKRSKRFRPVRKKENPEEIKRTFTNAVVGH